MTVNYNSPVTFLESKYPPFYEDMEELHSRYKTFFTLYEDVLSNLTTTLSDISVSTKSQERIIAQIDYLTEAYSILTDLTVSINANINIQLRPKSNIQNFKNVIKELSVLCDILEDNIVRGTVPSVKLLPPLSFDGDTKEQEDRLKIVELYQKKDDSKYREFCKAFAELRPEFVIVKSDVGELSVEQAHQMLKRAKHHCASGKFSHAIHACYLVLLFPLEQIKKNKTLVTETKMLLLTLLRLTGTKNTSLIETLHFPLSDIDRNRILLRKYGSTSDKNVTNIIYQEFGGYINVQKNFVEYISTKFKYVDKTNEYYKAALCNFVCYKLYLGDMPAHVALKEPSFDLDEFTKVLRFFPKGHVAHYIIANIQNALFDSNIENTYEYIAEFLIKYRTKRRYALNDLTPDSKRKELRRAVLANIAGINKSIDTLDYIKRIAESAKTERESDWPKPNVYSSFLRTTPFPYVDGNYTIKVKVDIALGNLDIIDASTLPCDQKRKMLQNVYKVFKPFK